MSDVGPFGIYRRTLEKDPCKVGFDCVSSRFLLDGETSRTRGRRVYRHVVSMDICPLKGTPVVNTSRPES